MSDSSNDRRWFRSHWSNCRASIQKSMKKDLPAFMIQMDFDKKWEFYGPKEVLEVLKPVKDQLEAVMLAWQREAGKHRQAGRGFDEESVVQKAVLCKPSVPIAQIGTREARSTVSAWVRALTPGKAKLEFGEGKPIPATVPWPEGIPWCCPSKPPKGYKDWLGALRKILTNILLHVGEDPATYYKQAATADAAPRQPALTQPPVPQTPVDQHASDDTRLNFSLLVQEQTEEQTTTETEPAEVEAAGVHSTPLDESNEMNFSLLQEEAVPDTEQAAAAVEVHHSTPLQSPTATPLPQSRSPPTTSPIRRAISPRQPSRRHKRPKQVWTPSGPSGAS